MWGGGLFQTDFQRRVDSGLGFEGFEVFGPSRAHLQVLYGSLAAMLQAALKAGNMGLSENRGTLFWGSYNQDRTIKGTISGSPTFGNPICDGEPHPNEVRSPREPDPRLPGGKGTDSVAWPLLWRPVLKHPWLKVFSDMCTKP